MSTLWPADPPGEERLSSRFTTLFYRVVWPVFGLGSVPGFLVLPIWWRPATIEELLLPGFAALVLMPGFWWAACRPARWVWATADGLRISDGRREARVPYSAIEDVRRVWYLRHGAVRVALRSSTPVGRSFLLYPTFDHGGGVVGRLRAQARLTAR